MTSKANITTDSLLSLSLSFSLTHNTSNTQAKETNGTAGRGTSLVLSLSFSLVSVPDEINKDVDPNWPDLLASIVSTR